MRFRLKNGKGKHIHVVDGEETRYNAGDVINVRSKFELGNALDKFEQLDPDEEDEGVVKKETAKKFKVKKIKGTKKYNVVKVSTGEKANDAPLTKEEAEDLAGDME
jgi:hypothetical protein